MSEMLSFSGQSFTLMLWDLGPPPRCLNLDVYVPHITVVDRLIYKSDIVVKQKKCIEGVSETSDIFAPINKDSKSR